ncbi:MULTISPECIES: flagellar basal body rod protein FlgC [Nitrosomonas]|uniref:Flagellar basal-body rod protein FlgC n=1 Tax=Nitrosomonas europaea (strain ATCC 19718 / CIP 103999 / KCTC 2705 / NBRC 14298) TaxID=228410 RepID=Q82XH1_NITEU|nr:MULTISPECIES: flagellar basal body rod protein FlgC [Nitrosomonas]MCE7917356.1 flagellar basal body rod protein FlgC [Nitrosomonas sp. PRO5]MDL1863850.1 flagellar basal body rod protein FlgC [Betaproteobacteria bacterium PRO5]KXK49714.1 MAG: flagella basal body rod protein [Nitrosomonas europaea]MBV6389116.1 Flagellar basal-body rod protein FlgC [Nitrosomonas europaea]MCC6916444.1 flagellar basal body rod protein FlgC [Nitrosomonas sp.]
MSLFSVFNVAGSSMAAQSQRLNVVASNLANADSATSSTGEAYRSRQVVFRTIDVTADKAKGVKVAGVVNDPSPMRVVYDPKHPMANEKGYVTLPNVNVVDEMVNMMSASRSYQNSVDMMNVTKTLLQKALTIGQ